MKTVYVIHGSEDGIIGCASNIKAAYRIATDYTGDDSSNKAIPYAKLVRLLKTQCEVLIHDDIYQTHSTVHSMVLETK